MAGSQSQPPPPTAADRVSDEEFLVRQAAWFMIGLGALIGALAYSGGGCG